MFYTLFYLMGTMFLFILTGVILRNQKVITNEGKKCLTDIIIDVILPCNIIKAFSAKLDSNTIQRFLVLLLVAVGAQILSLLIAKFCYKKTSDQEMSIFQYATVCSNSGFIGNPLAEGIFGELGLTYASVYLLPQRIVMWTAGVSYFNRSEDKKTVYRKVLTHPCMVATYIGIVIMMFHISLPELLGNAIRSFSNCCMPFTMMYMGVILADVDLKYLIDRKQLYYCFLRLILMPAVLYVICLICKVDPLITGVSVLLLGMPAGSTTSLLAYKYGVDETAATKCVVLSTLFSILTIPAWSIILLHGIG